MVTVSLDAVDLAAVDLRNFKNLMNLDILDVTDVGLNNLDLVTFSLDAIDLANIELVGLTNMIHELQMQTMAARSTRPDPRSLVHLVTMDPVDLTGPDSVGSLGSAHQTQY